MGNEGFYERIEEKLRPYGPPLVLAIATIYLGLLVKGFTNVASTPEQSPQTNNVVQTESKKPNKLENVVTNSPPSMFEKIEKGISNYFQEVREPYSNKEKSKNN